MNDSRPQEPAGNPHTVTVTTKLMFDEDLGHVGPVVDTVTFTCTAPPDADCRTYPNCDCESWTYSESKTRDESGHLRVSGQQCWMVDWFDNGSATYVGLDADDMRDDGVPPIARTGTITRGFADEWVEWDWDTYQAVPNV
jgi:hypothetical protein